MYINILHFFMCTAFLRWSAHSMISDRHRVKYVVYVYRCRYTPFSYIAYWTCTIFLHLTCSFCKIVWGTLYTWTELMNAMIYIGFIFSLYKRYRQRLKRIWIAYTRKKSINMEWRQARAIPNKVLFNIHTAAHTERNCSMTAKKRRKKIIVVPENHDSMCVCWWGEWVSWWLCCKVCTVHVCCCW